MPTLQVIVYQYKGEISEASRVYFAGSLTFPTVSAGILSVVRQIFRKLETQRERERRKTGMIGVRDIMIGAMFSSSRLPHLGPTRSGEKRCVS